MKASARTLKLLTVCIVTDLQLYFYPPFPLLQNWASADHALGQFVYHSYNEKDFDAFFNATTPYSKHFFLGIGKPNMSRNAAPESKYWQTKLDSLLANSGELGYIKLVYS